MANKALATRQKMRLKVEPSQAYGKPRNPVAVAAKQRSAGSHERSKSAERQLLKRLLAKAPLKPEDSE
ncbi:hypothetical protein [Pseudoduganella sp. GCM10020061]|jgi:hypothetical protein|uniref:hypothetical protein n=1 Tax=Pseudoduganella sp. GCM10020061 TaxID=3317345 RepID=UPI00362EFEA1